MTAPKGTVGEGVKRKCDTEYGVMGKLGLQIKDVPECRESVDWPCSF